MKTAITGLIGVAIAAALVVLAHALIGESRAGPSAPPVLVAAAGDARPGDAAHAVYCSVRVAPAFPRAPLAQGIEGWVEVEFTVQPDGSVAGASVVASSPQGVFDAAALGALSRWRCDPRIVGGTAVARRAAQFIEFRRER